MRHDRPSNRSYSSERRSGATALVFAGIVLVMMVCSCLVATRDRTGSAPASHPIPMQELK